MIRPAVSHSPNAQILIFDLVILWLHGKEKKAVPVDNDFLIILTSFFCENKEEHEGRKGDRSKFLLAATEHIIDFII